MANYKIDIKQHKVADFKDINLEYEFLGMILKKPSTFKMIVNNFNENCITNQKVKKIFIAIRDISEVEDHVINDMAVLDVMGLSKLKLQAYKTIWKKCLKGTKKKFKKTRILAVKKRLKQLYDARLVEIATRDVLRNLKDVTTKPQLIERSYEIIDYLSTAVGKEVVKSYVVNPVSNYKKWLGKYNEMQKNPKKVKGVPTGIDPIDRVITGLRDSEFGLVITDTGVGKSIFLLDCAVHCWEKYGDVLYVTIEMSAEQIENRFWCRASGLSNDKFRKLTLNKREKAILSKICERKAKNENSFNIIDMPEGCSVNDIVVKIKEHIRRTKKKPKLICVDYLNIVSDENGEVSLAWEAQVGNAMRMKQKIARAFKVPTWSGCQVTGENIAFGKHIKDNIDIGVRLEEDEDTDMTDILRVSYPKTRDFRGVEHVVQTDRDRMTMYAPGAQRKQERLTKYKASYPLKQQSNNDNKKIKKKKKKNKG